LGLNTDALTGAGARNGVTPEEVYKRAFTTVWTSIATIGFAAAVEKGLSRLKSTADMDVAMSARDTMVAFAQSEDRIVGYTRIADPACCDFCQMLDGVTTGPTEPQPLHNNCGCDAEPIFATSSAASDVSDNALAPGEVIDQVAIEQHGELGPVITNKRDSFTGPNDLND
jgi:hypothetical protein